ncbi:MAG: spore germination protein [Bacillota bacterium]|jgi:spore germination protein KA
MNLRLALRRMLNQPRQTHRGHRNRPAGEALSADLERNLAAIKATLRNPSDLTIRSLSVSGKPPANISVVFLSSMADSAMVRSAIVEPFTSLSHAARDSVTNSADLVEKIRINLPVARPTSSVNSMNALIAGLLEGKAAVLIDGVREALCIDAAVQKARALEQPAAESTVLGPQMGLTESLDDSLALIRSRLRHPNLRVERTVIGKKSRTEVRMLYLEEVAPREIVSELRRRLKAIDTDVILDVGMIRELIGDRPYSPFIIERLTERPDTVVGELNLGRIAILMEGSPFALLQPSQFFTLFESAEDYYMNPWLTSALRITRMLAYIISTIATPFYVAVVNYHRELVPLRLLLNIAATQEGVPFPLPATALVTEIVLDIVREAGIRLPQHFGPAVSIVGALVLGQSAVQAGFVPPGLIIVVMFATIASFAVPRAEKALAYRLLRFPLLLLASTLGFPGLAIGTVAIIYHLASLKTLGIPYFTLYSPGHVSRLAKKVIRVPAALQPTTRPLAQRDRVARGPVPKLRDPVDND